MGGQRGSVAHSTCLKANKNQMRRIHVIGAGLAGLSAAITATGVGRPVTVYEATGAGGGRCRSYFDSELGIRIDNGNHLLLTGNKSAFAYIDAIGARARIIGPSRPIFPFADLKTGRQWTLRPSRGRLPWWLLSADRRVPKTTAGEHLALRKVGREWDDTVMSETMRHSSLYWLMLEPFSVAALNTRPHEALACLFGSVLRETLLKGGKACLPRLAKDGLSEALVEPALETLRKRGATIEFNRRVTGISVEAGRAISLRIGDEQVPLQPSDTVVLAVPPWVAGELMPNITVPDAFEAILNVHYKTEVKPARDVAEAGFIGLVNGTAQWIFVKPDHVSVTVSAANKIVDRSADDLAQIIWRNVAKVFDLDGEHAADVPLFRVIKERRATIVANVTQEERRPSAQTEIENLALAGDWTDTRLPGTIEGAVRSGVIAANLMMDPAKPATWKRKKSLRDDD
jgi:squalene-associated FAD-dependent desaturase